MLAITGLRSCEITRGFGRRPLFRTSSRRVRCDACHTLGSGRRDERSRDYSLGYKEARLGQERTRVKPRASGARGLRLRSARAGRRLTPVGAWDTMTPTWQATANIATVIWWNIFERIHLAVEDLGST